MSANPLNGGKCPSFPSVFNLSSSQDLLRVLPFESLTLFFRRNKMGSGHYTLMWTMAKVMRKMAHGVGGFDGRLVNWDDAGAGERELAGDVERWTGWSLGSRT